MVEERLSGQDIDRGVANPDTQVKEPDSSLKERSFFIVERQIAAWKLEVKEYIKMSLFHGTAAVLLLKHEEP